LYETHRLEYEPFDPNYRNGAHRGPAFLPWHRQFLYEFESKLRDINPSVTIPYWDWTTPTSRFNIFTSDFMGSNGIIQNDGTSPVLDGPFAKGKWKITILPDDTDPSFKGDFLQRQFARWVNSLPSTEHLNVTLQETLYDTPPYNSSPFTIGFRNRLEGWIKQSGDWVNVKTEGSQMHNRVHLFIGGSMRIFNSKLI